MFIAIDFVILTLRLPLAWAVLLVLCTAPLTGAAESKTASTTRRPAGEKAAASKKTRKPAAVSKPLNRQAAAAPSRESFAASAARLTALTSAPVVATASVPADGQAESASAVAATRLQRDVAAMQTFRPSYPFWSHVFTTPDGAIVYGSAEDGRLLATFRIGSDWTSEGMWADPALATTRFDEPLPTDLSERRDAVAAQLANSTGPVIHNPSRGLFVLPHAQRVGGLVNEWRAIYERFGVPGDLGLAQAMVESGFNGEARSEAGAIGFCQWMRGNWRRLQLLAPSPIEAGNQTTQAPYCAAYLAVLATKYQSFIPALSEHHTGGANVGRIVVNGERLGGASIQDQYFLGAEFVHDLRRFAPATYSDVYGTYGPRSFRYAEMIFGNMTTVARLAATVPQERVFAMRTPRERTLTEIATVSGLTADEVRRFNPALTRRVPVGATIYLPRYVGALGRDVSFWHRPATEEYESALRDLLAAAVPLDEWSTPAFDRVLEESKQRFLNTRSEEGTVMATVLAYVLAERRQGRHGALLEEFRASERIQQLFDSARQARDAYRQSSAAPVATD